MLLVLALLTVVVGVTLLAAHGVVGGQRQPDSGSARPALAGVPEADRQRMLVGPNRSGDHGACLAAGLLAFGSQRAKLRQGRWLPWLIEGVIASTLSMAINVGSAFYVSSSDIRLVCLRQRRFGRSWRSNAFCLLLAFADAGRFRVDLSPTGPALGGNG